MRRRRPREETRRRRGLCDAAAPQRRRDGAAGGTTPPPLRGDATAPRVVRRRRASEETRRRRGCGAAAPQEETRRRRGCDAAAPQKRRDGAAGAGRKDRHTGPDRHQVLIALRGRPAWEHQVGRSRFRRFSAAPTNSRTPGRRIDPYASTDDGLGRQPRLAADHGHAALPRRQPRAPEARGPEGPEAVWKSTSAPGAPDNSSLSHFSAMTRPTWLGRAASNRHRHAIEQASRRWRGGRRDDSARTRHKIWISTQAGRRA